MQYAGLPEYLIEDMADWMAFLVKYGNQVCCLFVFACVRVFHLFVDP